MPKVFNKRTNKIPTDAVYVGRPSKWGNPYKVGNVYTRAGRKPIDNKMAVILYEEYLYDHPELIRAAMEELKGKDLVCWCSPLPCHANILLRIVNMEAMKEKIPHVLSEEEIMEWCRTHLTKEQIANRTCREEAQRDADAAYYEPLVQQAEERGKQYVLDNLERNEYVQSITEKWLKQAKEEVARKTMELAKHEFEYWEGSNTEDFIYSQFLERK